MMKALFASVLVTVMSCGLLAQNTAPQVTVWLYRPNVDNFSSAVPLYLDGRRLVNLGHAQFFGIQVPPGLHAFNWTNQPGARQVVVPVGAEPQAYFEVTFTSSSPFLSINPLSADKAMQAMNGLRPVDPNGVFDPGVIVPAQALQAAVKSPSADLANNAKPAPLSVPAQQNAATASPASVPQISSSNAVKLRGKTPKEDAARNLDTKAEKETLWVKAVTHEFDIVTTPGAAETLCGSTARAIRSSTADNVNCNTTYNPPQQHRLLAIWRLDFVNKVKAENGQIYTITCSANWIGSNCASLREDDRFKAEVEKTTMWITAQRGENQGKQVRIKYKILDTR
jgi:hypothetical protein